MQYVKYLRVCNMGNLEIEYPRTEEVRTDHGVFKLENQGEIDNYRFLLQTARPFSRLTFLCARQKITTNLQTKVCIR